MRDTIEPSLLKAITDEPEVDLHRLAYADWLEEQGDEKSLDRAWFIRHQLSRPQDTAQCYVSYSDLNVKPSDGRAYKLVWPAAWQAKLEHLFPHGGEVVWQRGFVKWCSMRMCEWMEHGPRIVARHPIETVTLTDRYPAENAAVDPPPGRRWAWIARLEPTERYHLPVNLARFMGSEMALGGLFCSAELAFQTLSVTCIRWAIHVSNGGTPFGQFGKDNI